MDKSQEPRVKRLCWKGTSNDAEKKGEERRELSVLGREETRDITRKKKRGITLTLSGGPLQWRAQCILHSSVVHCVAARGKARTRLVQNANLQRHNGSPNFPGVNWLALGKILRGYCQAAKCGSSPGGAVKGVRRWLMCGGSDMAQRRSRGWVVVHFNPPAPRDYWLSASSSLKFPN